MSWDAGDALADMVREYRAIKSKAERALDQVDDTAYFVLRDEGGNSIAVLVRHMAGNMRSRWRDFLTTDGEKPDRHRDGEFEIPEGATRARLMGDWEASWALCLDTIEALEASHLGDTITIRREPMTVYQALVRQLTHYTYHLGQIVQLARAEAGSRWKPLSIPRGGSEQAREAGGTYLSR